MRSFVTLLLVLVLSATSNTYAQRPAEQPDAARILHQMQTLNTLGSVLYIAAHPDDENTRLISYLVNGMHMRTGYLSLTRGSGGQNLIGSEKGDALGIIRTQELMEARHIDGGEQFFTRAVDFGYSKSAEESFQKWGKEEVLSDVVRVIRTFRPDVIITRFPSDGGGGHGHHTASAILAKEAFSKAADPKAFPEQLEEGLTLWQPKRLLWNGSTWWRKDLAELAKGDPNWLPVDVGGYDPLLGLSYTEIAGRSRSMHKSQGFGASESRGELIEYLHHEHGTIAVNMLMEGVDVTWGRVLGGENVGKMIQQMIRSYDASSPERSVEVLDLIRGQVTKLPNSSWTTEKLIEIDALLKSLTGTVVEVNSESPFIPTGAVSKLTLSALTRSTEQVSLLGIDPSFQPKGESMGKDLPQLSNSPIDLPLEVNEEKEIHQPFWLAAPHDALYSITDKRLIGKPVSEPYSASMDVAYGGSKVTQPVQVIHRWVDRVDGERIRQVMVTPIASITPSEGIIIVRGESAELTVTVEALTDDLSGNLMVTLPPGWGTTKDLKGVSGIARGEKRTFTYKVMKGKDAQQGPIKFKLTGDKGDADKTMHVIDYPHILPQVYYSPAEAILVPLDVKVNAKLVGYIEGSGDDVPAAIEQLGVQVQFIDPSTTNTAKSLEKYDAIVVGVRAYNKVTEMADLNPILMKYVENGGNLVVQYNTRSSDMMVPDSLIGPYPFKLSRDRVTVEEAPPTFLQRDNPLLKFPNAISAEDFNGWVQERGLYYVGERDEHYTPLISWNDPGEDPLDGALISCSYGNGRYIYTGISFFRQLPAGVPGAYRLFANLISKVER